MRHGEIWWYEPPHSSSRPYLVMTRDEAIPVLTHLLGEVCEALAFATVC